MNVFTSLDFPDLLNRVLVLSKFGIAITDIAIENADEIAEQLEAWRCAYGTYEF